MLRVHPNLFPYEKKNIKMTQALIKKLEKLDTLVINLTRFNKLGYLKKYE